MSKTNTGKVRLVSLDEINTDAVRLIGRVYFDTNKCRVLFAFTDEFLGQPEKLQNAIVAELCDGIPLALDHARLIVPLADGSKPS